MGKGTIDHLIIKSTYEEPRQYWSYDRETRTFGLEERRRRAGYVIASETSKAFDDPGIFVPIPSINRIRPRVKTWRVIPEPRGLPSGCLSTGTIPKRERTIFFFCQLEAIETLIWLTEAAAWDKVGVDIPSDGGSFSGLCSKMATGWGKPSSSGDRRKGHSSFL